MHLIRITGLSHVCHAPQHGIIIKLKEAGCRRGGLDVSISLDAADRTGSCLNVKIVASLSN